MLLKSDQLAENSAQPPARANCTKLLSPRIGMELHSGYIYEDGDGQEKP
jgi:hypothetical protein